MAERYDLLADILPTFKITKPIRLIELFAGYGSQALALKYLGADFEHWKIAEWNYKSFEAYHQIHMPEDTTDYSAGLNKEQLAEYLLGKGISSDWNKAMTTEQVTKLKENELRKIYNSIKATHNLVDISRVNGKDLDIVDQDKYCYIMTYSFPCNDLSLAGSRKGMAKGSGTRSGLLWEVERILNDLENLPDVLLMENVPLVHGKDNEEHFRDWIHKLVTYGYENYFEDLIATDYGVPQIRERTYMVSVKNAYYDFPQPIRLTKKMKDLLENEVNEKYFLSEKALKGLKTTNERNKELGRGFVHFEPTNGDGNAKTIRAGYKGDTESTYILQPRVVAGYGEMCNKGTQYHNQNRIYQGDNSTTLATSFLPWWAIGEEDVQIRRLTPTESFRLMGVKDDDIKRVAANDTTKYHLAGDSIVTTVLMAIFGEMLEIDWEKKVREVTEYGRN